MLPKSLLHAAPASSVVPRPRCGKSDRVEKEPSELRGRQRGHGLARPGLGVGEVCEQKESRQRRSGGAGMCGSVTCCFWRYCWTDEQRPRRRELRAAAAKSRQAGKQGRSGVPSPVRLPPPVPSAATAGEGATASSSNWQVQPPPLPRAPSSIHRGHGDGHGQTLVLSHRAEPRRRRVWST